MTLLIEELSRVLDGDVERLRDVGRRTSRAPSYEPLRRVAGAIVSARTLCDSANRHAAPASFPHLILTAQFTGGHMPQGPGSARPGDLGARPV